MTLKFYHLIRHITTHKSQYPSARQVVYHGRTEKEVEKHLERLQDKVNMPTGCFYTIEHY